MSLTLMFYEKLNGKTDEFLEEHEYSREEVTDGIKYVVDFYGYGKPDDAFVDENALGLKKTGNTWLGRYKNENWISLACEVRFFLF